jgi:hypothetical protein
MIQAECSTLGDNIKYKREAQGRESLSWGPTTEKDSKHLMRSIKSYLGI